MSSQSGDLNQEKTVLLIRQPFNAAVRDRDAEFQKDHNGTYSIVEHFFSSREV